MMPLSVRVFTPDRVRVREGPRHLYLTYAADDSKRSWWTCPCGTRRCAHIAAAVKATGRLHGECGSSRNAPTGNIATHDHSNG